MSDLVQYKASSPTTLFNEKDAAMPERYEVAKAALAECSRIDECKEWSNKAQALASYARQAKDPTLYNLALKISIRAKRQMGKMLKEFDARGGSRTKKDGDDHFALSQREAAKNAGLSERQTKTAVRIANIPDNDFEGMVESGGFTVTAMAERGKKSHPSKNKKLVDDDAMQVWASILDFEEDGLLDLDPQSLFSEMFGHMQADMRRLIGPVTKWLERMIHEK